MAIGFGSYEVARSGMYVSERALAVTGHNISNVNTKGFVRQQLISETSNYYGSQGYQIGLGASIQNTRQIRHQFLDNIYRRESTSLGYWETRNKTLQDIQNILGDPMEVGLQEVMNQFWDAWQELSKEPDSLTVRALVAQRGEALVNQINHIGTQLDKLQKDLNTELKIRIDEMNSILKGIATLNTEILKQEINRDNANDYRDQRNNLVDRLSKLANVEVFERLDGQLDVTLGGYLLVSKGEYTSLVAEETSETGMFYVPKIMGTEIEVPIKSGIIKGLIESRGEVLGVRGSIENGTPNTKADITFVVDVSDSNAANLPDIIDSIKTYVDELKRRGIDYNLHLITYADSVNHFYFDSNADNFLDAVDALAGTGETGNDFGAVVTFFDSISDFRPEANRYAIVFTQENIDTALTQLNDNGVKSAIATDNIISDINNDINKEISLVNDTLNIVPDLRKRLNALVNVLVREVNFLHTSGKTLGPPAVQGDNFFVAINPDYPLEMGNIKLNENILLNLNNIVASTSDASGDNTIALAIANLRGKECLRDIKGILDIDEYYQSIILNVGNKGSEAAGVTESQQKLVNYVEIQRQAIMGVSMDEEVSNMMKYKFSYSAASRAINVIDEMMETIISRMGLVGR